MKLLMLLVVKGQSVPLLDMFPAHKRPVCAFVGAGHVASQFFDDILVKEPIVNSAAPSQSMEPLIIEELIEIAPLEDLTIYNFFPSKIKKVYRVEKCPLKSCFNSHSLQSNKAVRVKK